ncbi:hypothetical protein ACFS07_29060 [Undibacterium arcticum]
MTLTLTFRFGAAVCAQQKMDQKWTLSEPKASFVHFPFLLRTNGNPQGSDCAAAFFCLLFLGETRKVSGRRSTTGQQSQINRTSDSPLNMRRNALHLLRPTCYLLDEWVVSGDTAVEQDQKNRHPETKGHECTCSPNVFPLMFKRS